jgi:hypothetical protein
MSSRSFKKNWLAIWISIFLLIGLSWLRFGLVHNLKVDNTPFPVEWNYPVFLLYIGALLLLAVNYWKLVWKNYDPTRTSYRKEAYLIVILASLMLPYLSNDIFVYLGHGYLSNHGTDVFGHTDILKNSPWIVYIDAWPDGPFVYGPINLIPSKIANWIGGENMWITLIAYKVLMMLIGFGMIELLQRLINNPKDLLIIIIAPAFWLHNIGHLHNDMIGAFFVMISVLCIVKNKLFLAALFIGIALASKISVIIYIPFIFCFYYFNSQENIPKRIGLMFLSFLLFCIAVIGCYAIFYKGPTSITVPFDYLSKQHASKSFAEVLGEMLNVLFSDKENSIGSEFNKEVILKEDTKVHWWAVSQIIFNVIGVVMMIITTVLFVVKTKLKFNKEITVEYFTKISFIFFFFYLHIFQAWYLILLAPLIMITENIRIKKYFMILCVYSGAHTIIYVIARPSILYYLVPGLVIINIGLFLWQFRKNYLSVEADLPKIPG